jgi:hypothetical protein
MDMPFFANTGDDTHCFQATLKMVLKYFDEDRDFSWHELDTLTAKQPGMWTWPMAGLCWLAKQGYDVINIDEFDYEAFGREGADYLVSKFGHEIADEQIKHSVIRAEQQIANAFMKYVKVEIRVPDVNEIMDFLNEGYAVIVNVNARSLYDKSGFVGHFVVITEFDGRDISLHDPGPPARPNQTMPIAQFLRGLDYPDSGSRNLIAIKR